MSFVPEVPLDERLDCALKQVTTMLYSFFGWFPDVCVLYADVSEHSVPSS